MSKTDAEKEEMGMEVLALCFKTELKPDDARSIMRYIAEQADTNVRDKWGHTSLMYASRDGRSKIVRELLKGRADPNMANRCFPIARPILISTFAIFHLYSFSRDFIFRNDGWTSLMFAAVRNHSLIVADLLAHGADSMAVTSRWGYTALDIARKEGHADVVRLLQAHQRLHHPEAALHLQTESSHTAACQLLKCGGCGAVFPHTDFASHCTEVHAGDENFDWSCSIGKMLVFKIPPLGLTFLAVEDSRDAQASFRDFDEEQAGTLQLQHEFDVLLQKAESDDKTRQLKEEAELFVHSWPDGWFRKSKKVPNRPLDPETDEVLRLPRTPVHVLF